MKVTKDIDNTVMRWKHNQFVDSATHHLYHNREKWFILPEKVGLTRWVARVYDMTTLEFLGYLTED